MVAVAKYGGVIAACRKTDCVYVSIKSSDPLSEHICFYSNEGKLINKLKFEEKDKIVGFDFIDDELLLIVMESGTYYLVEPYS